MTNELTQEWKSVVPVPLEAPPAKFHHFKFGKPIDIYPYTDSDGQLVGFICRFIGPDGKKEIRPRSYGYFNGKLGWYWKQISDNRPPFRARDVHQNQEKSILFVEGEKSALAAAEKFPDYVASTSMGGSNSAHKTDWSFLKGRKVVIWPDNDLAGIKYAKSVARFAKNAGAAEIRIVELPKDFPERWDLADPLPEWVDDQALLQLIINAAIADRTENDSAYQNDVAARNVGHPFRLTPTHVEYFFEPKGEGEGEWLKVSGRLEVLSLTHDNKNQNWGRMLRFKDLNQITHVWAMPMRMLAGDARGIREVLLDQGLVLEVGKGPQELLIRYIQSCKPEKRIQCVQRTGWHEDVYVLPNEIFGNKELILQQEQVTSHAFNVQGTLEEWKKDIGAFAVGNSRLIASICAAFASPLLTLFEEESGGIHLRGPSSIGKSTALWVAGSVWGGGGIRGFIRQWRATANGLEGIAAMHCDSLLILDELGQASAHEVGDAVYMLCNNIGKSRANQNGTAKAPFEWRLWLLSSGEISLSTKIEEVKGNRATAGQEVRVIDIPADAGCGLGIFETIHGFPSSEKLANHLRKSAVAFYGSPIRTFLKAIIKAEKNQISAIYQSQQSKILQCLQERDVDGQVQRVAQRFALLATAGEIAIDMDILPWPKGEASRAMKQLFVEWVRQRGGTGAYEVTSMLQDIKYFFEVHGGSRFCAAEEVKRGEQKVALRAGFYKTIKNERYYYVLPGVFIKEICANRDFTMVAKVLKKLGILIPGEKNRNQRYASIPGLARTRCYVIGPKLFTIEFGGCESDGEGGTHGDDGATRNSPIDFGVLDRDSEGPMDRTPLGTGAYDGIEQMEMPQDPISLKGVGTDEMSCKSSLVPTSPMDLNGKEPVPLDVEDQSFDVLYLNALDDEDDFNER